MGRTLSGSARRAAEAGGYKGKPTFFQMVGPWTRVDRQEERATGTQEKVSSYLFFVIVIAVLVSSVGFAWNNLKLHRVDRRGAFRTAYVCFVASVVVWVFRATHVSEHWAEWTRFADGTGKSLFRAAWLWLLYVAFEPYVRRRWPHVLISWTRLIMGRLRDPLVGRAILIGALFGLGMNLAGKLYDLAPAWFGAVSPAPDWLSADVLLGGSHIAAQLLSSYFMLVALWHLFLLFALRVLLRKQWVSIPAYIAVLTAGFVSLPTGSYGDATVYICVLSNVLFLSLMVVVVMRFGLLSFAVAILVNGRLSRLPIVLDFSTWYTTSSIVSMLALAALAAYGFHTALAGRPLLKDELLET